MLQPFALLVHERDGQVEVTVPFVTSRAFAGPSQSRVYDDVALHLMERVIEAPQAQLPDYLFAPETILRRPKVSVGFRDGAAWEGRLAVVLRRWPGDEHFEATIPRLGPSRIAVGATRDLDRTIARYLRDEARKTPEALVARLRGAVRPKGSEYLDWLEVDLELPTILPRTLRKKRRRAEPEAPTEEDAGAQKKSRAKRRRETPPVTLREVGTNLVNQVLDGRLPRVVGRDAVVERIVRRIGRPGAAVLLVGPAGAGKTAVIEEVVRRLTAEEDRLHARRDAWRVDGNRIIAGMSYVGQWEGRCEAMVHELSERGDVLVVEDLPSLVFAGRTRDEETHVAGYLDPHLAQGELRVLAECTAERLEACRDEAPAFFSRFHVVPIEPLDEATTVRTLVGRLRDLERAALDGPIEGRLRFSPEVPEAVLAFVRRFHTGRALPGAAIELLEQLGTEAPTTQRDDAGFRILDARGLVSLLAQKTGLPPFVLWEEDSPTHGAVREHFEAQIVAQPEAVDAMTELVTVLQQGLGDPHKPIASLLLVGPTGVGKTETAKALARFLFGSAERLVRFDMSDLADPGAATRLFGDPRHPDGELTRRIRQQPFAVILFDELEKAHPVVFDALLSLLGEGRLTSASGHTTDFTNTVVLMTSNLGVRDAESVIGFETSEAPDRRAHYVAAARGFFRPEFFNRIDRVVAYRSLGRGAVRPLVERALLELGARRGLQRAGVLVDVDDSLIDVLGDRGFDVRYGARALRREVEQRIAVPLARRLVEAPPDSTTLVSLFREGTDVGMDVWPLSAPPPTAGEPPAIRDFETLGRMHAELRGWIEERADVVDRARERLGEELARMNRGSLDDTALLDALAPVLDELEAHREALDRFFEDVLEGETYLPRVEPRTDADALFDERFVRRVVRPAPKQVEVLRRIRGELAELLFRLEATQREEEHLLLRVRPATRTPASATLGLLLARLVRWLGPRFGSVSWVWKSAEGWRGGDVSADALAHGFALRGYGLRAVFEPLAGFHMHTRFAGPDVITGLARLDLVGTDEDPITHLDALDAAHARWLEDRREGRAATPPEVPPPMRSHFQGPVVTLHDWGLAQLRERAARERS